MQHILFVCLGNICRSPMAEVIFQQLVADRQLADQFAVASVATSPEEEGNHPHPGALKTLREHGLDASDHRSRPITAADFAWADTIITMDHSNVANLKRLAPTPADAAKVHLCLDILPDHQHEAIDDPWYTHKFELTYQELAKSLPAWLDKLSQKTA
ncbi:protein-tyrosine-phosphatase [Levilactobacillus brevis]|uniref:low molecular weight protein-tyrosine-phosphatase n=1 Tax=Levilactobacillus brevis TaxID=1580 RepID=UPI0005800E79|nr:low molecular weight protein-tyrosine-phosphatase [Levilactobacillus brevis]ANN48455.1 protein-tyrosine-phosphatase [Levilactobacillus brevis]KID42810.1 Low molecular weight protein tyrosine phosphatase [Levilactobacillus brevis]QCZ42915.1 Protein-tyrosine-phosphatase [Levilactobacillus brevis]